MLTEVFYVGHKVQYSVTASVKVLFHMVHCNFRYLHLFERQKMVVM